MFSIYVMFCFVFLVNVNVEDGSWILVVICIHRQQSTHKKEKVYLVLTQGLSCTPCYHLGTWSATVMAFYLAKGHKFKPEMLLVFLFGLDAH